MNAGRVVWLANADSGLVINGDFLEYGSNCLRSKWEKLWSIIKDV